MLLVVTNSAMTENLVCLHPPFGVLDFSRLFSLDLSACNKIHQPAKTANDVDRLTLGEILP